MSSIQELAAMLLLIATNILNRQEQLNRLANTDSIHSHYDFIVVGGGTAGAAVAARLSEDTRVSVLLIEAGPVPNFLQDMEGLPPNIQQKEYDWGYKTVPKPNMAKGEAIKYARGKVLGGSSTVNKLVYFRGNPTDYDNWENEFGAKGWSWKDVLPYFLRYENNVNLRSSPYHSTKGPIGVSWPTKIDRHLKIWFQATKEAGYRFKDLNNGKQIGTNAASQKFILDGKRQSGSAGYLEPLVKRGRQRKNLHIVTNAHVTKVLFDTTNGSYAAAGVQVIWENEAGNKTLKVFANKEVILSAGVTNTPQILMLSGVGPRQHLKGVGIKNIVADLPVGQNFKDHLKTEAIAFDIKVANSSTFHGNDTFTIENLYEYYAKSRGPLVRGDWVVTFHASKHSANVTWPDLELCGKLPETVDNETVRIPTRASFVRPKSTGSIRLRSSDPFDSPLIDLDLLATELDWTMAREGIKEVVRIGLQPSLRKRALPVSQAPDCKCKGGEKKRRYVNGIFDPKTFMPCESAMLCLIRSTSRPDLHGVGTCRMGAASDPKAVVDERLRVRKLTRLRVVDASVMPLTPAANTMGPTLMVAEKGAQIIKDDYGLK